MNISNIITREEYDKIKILTYDQFSDYMTRLVKLCVEESLKVLPAVMNHLSNQANYLRQLSNEFYEKHPDLAKNKSLVAKIIEQVEGENPALRYEEVLEIAAIRAREAANKLKNVKEGFNPKDLDHFDSKLKELDS